MKKEIKSKIGETFGFDEKTLAQFVAIMELPDDMFDAIYDKTKIQMSQIFSDPINQQNLRMQLRMNPVDDLQALKDELPDFINEITDDETLSDKKRDLIKTIFEGAMDVIADLVEGGGREFIPVKVTKLSPDAILPKYAHATDAGADIFALEETVIKAGETKLVKTGIAIAVPAGYMVNICPRSGLSLKTGLRVANSWGIVDSDYRGEVCVIISNTGNEDYTINEGDKIAQMLINPTPRIKWQEVPTVEDLGETSRGNGGFGSTGKS